MEELSQGSCYFKEKVHPCPTPSPRLQLLHALRGGGGLAALTCRGHQSGQGKTLSLVKGPGRPKITQQDSHCLPGPLGSKSRLHFNQFSKELAGAPGCPPAPLAQLFSS